MASGPLVPPSASAPDGRGGRRAALFLVAVEFLERGGFCGVAGVQGNLIMYLTGPLGLSTAAAAAGVNGWAGAVSVLPLLGAFAADSCIGRYRAVLAAGVLYLLSVGMLTVSSVMQPPRPDPARCHGAAAACSTPASPGRVEFFYAALYLVALAQSFYRPCSQALGADQYRHGGDGGGGALASRSSFFNWINFAGSWGFTFSVAGLSYVQENVGWTVGFGACWVLLLAALSVFLLGTRTYHVEQRVDTKPFEQLAMAARTWMAWLFPPKDAADTARLLVPDGQEGKGVVAKLLPIWVTSLGFAVIMAQPATLFTKQGSTMDRRLGDLVVPPAALQSFVTVAVIAFIPLYDRALVPLARRVTNHPSGITMLQRIGTGMAIACVSMLGAALVEARRLRAASDAGLLDQPDATVPMSLWWMVPQYVLIGVACVFAIVGLDELFYDQVPGALRSIGLALSISIMGAGNYASGVLVWAIDRVTRSMGQSWFSDNLNRAHLDYFYWLLAGIGALEVLVFLYFARRYDYMNKGRLG